MSSYQAIFESPLAHEAAPEGSFESSYESGYEAAMEGSGEASWESYEAGHAGESAYEQAGEFSFENELGYNPEGTFEEEWANEGDPFFGNILGAITGALGLGELGITEAEIGFEGEWSGEGSYESDQFFGGVLDLLKRAASKVLPVARRLAPGVMKTIGSLVPGAGPAMGMLGRLIAQAESEAQQLEAQLFGQQEMWEVANTEQSHEAALAEVLAAEAVTATSEAEAVARIAASLPITITIVGGRAPLRPVLPALTQANAHLVRSLRRRGPAGRQLLRLIPTINRRAAITLRRLARSGQRITTPVAVRALAASTRHVLGNGSVAGPAFIRNGALRARSAPLVSNARVFQPTNRRGRYPASMR
jgi:hypothetical protein